MRAFLVTVLILFAPMCAKAADGVLEINQICAAGAGCFPGDDPGFPVRILNSGSYILTSALVVPQDVDGVTSQQADSQYPADLDITLDLNGFSISSTTTCSASGADFECSHSSELNGKGINFAATGTGSFTIRNGVVRGMANIGVYCFPECIIESIHVTENALGGIFSDGQIHNSNAHINGVFGIFNDSQSGVTQGCRANSNGGSGISGHGSFLNNAARSNYGSGMTFNNATAIGNRVFGNSFVSDTGVFCLDCVLRDNQISNADTGVDFVDTASLFGGNVIEGGTADLANAENAIQDGTNLCSGSPCP